jgi:RNA polymerase sigma-70 factor (ECF subfamily)
MNVTDEQLFTRASTSDAEAVEELLVRHLPGLRAYVRLKAGPRVRAHEEVSDLVQSACREVLQDVGRHRWKDEDHFHRWLYVTALHKILDRNRYWKAAKRDAGEVPLSGPQGDNVLADCYRTVCSPSRIMEQGEALICLEAVFDQLPEDYREVILLSRIVGLSHDEIAEQMGRSKNAITVLLSRALARLASLL